MKYSWNRNAAHHRIAATKFAAIALFIGLVVMLIATGFTLPEVRSIQTYAMSALMAMVIFLIVFTAVFSLLFTSYRTMCQLDRISDTTPPPHLPHLKQKPYESSGRTYGTWVFDDSGGVREE